MNTLLEDVEKVLEIWETKTLLAHEQTISNNLKRLKEGMLNIGHLVDPLVVDRTTGVVLDGNHRLKVLEIIECPHAAVQAVDYASPEIGVGTWLPALMKKPQEVFSGKDHVKLEKVDYEVGRKAVDSLKAPFMACSKDVAYLVNPGSYKLKEMVEEQVYALSLLNSGEVKYIPDNEAKMHLESGYTVLQRRCYTKAEIVKTAQGHAPLPPKSTRHLIPGRIIRLNMKLGWLHMSKDEAAKELRTMLERRAYNGNVRKYYEPVIVIY